MHQSLLEKVLLDYGEEIKSHFIDKLLDHGYEDEMKPWLIHLAKIYDSLLLDEIFQNLISLNKVDLKN